MERTAAKILLFDKMSLSDHKQIETRIEFDSIRAAHEMPTVKSVLKKKIMKNSNKNIEKEPFVAFCSKNLDELERQYF